MSIRAGILGVLIEQDAYGLQIHGELEERTARIGRINVGQIYSTLDRLTASGSVMPADPTGDGLPRYRVTPEGRQEFLRWTTGLDPDSSSAWSDTVFQVLLVSSLPSQDAGPVLDHLEGAWRAVAETPGDDLAVIGRRTQARAMLEWLGLAREEAASRTRPVNELRPRRGRRPAAAPERERDEAGERAL